MYSGKQIFKCWSEVIKYLNLLGLLYNEENRKIHKILAGLAQLIFIHFICVAQGFHVWKTLSSLESKESLFKSAQAVFVFLAIYSINLKAIWFRIKRDKIIEIKQDIEDLLTVHELYLGKNTNISDLRLIKHLRYYVVFSLASTTILGSASFVNFDDKKMPLSVWVPFDDFENDFKFILSVLFATFFGCYAFIFQISVDFSVICSLDILEGAVQNFFDNLDHLETSGQLLDIEKTILFTGDLRKIYRKIDYELSDVYLPSTIFGPMAFGCIAYCCIYVSYLLVLNATKLQII